MSSKNEKVIEDLVAALIVIDHNDPDECRILLMSIAALIQVSNQTKTAINKESN